MERQVNNDKKKKERHKKREKLNVIFVELVWDVEPDFRIYEKNYNSN